MCICARSFMSDSLRPHGLKPNRLLCPGDSLGKNTGVGCHFLLLWIFPTQQSKWCLLLWHANYLPVCHLRSPKGSGGGINWNMVLTYKMNKMTFILLPGRYCPSMTFCWYKNYYFLICTLPCLYF